MPPKFSYNRYGLYIKEKINKTVIETFKKNKWVVDSITKPLHAVGSYKVAEIKEICNLLNIDIMKNESNPQGLFLHPITGQRQHLCITGGEPLMATGQIEYR